MNKSTFKKLRSEFRNCERLAFQKSVCGKSFKANKSALIEKLNSTHGELGSFFGKLEKPTTRDLIVSMPVFRALDYPFHKFEAIL